MPINASVMFIGPLIALVAIAGLAIVLRWTFAKDDERPRINPFVDDYGLLCAVSAVDSMSAAQQICSVLAGGGIRATIAVGSDNLVRVLVFEQEFDQACRLVGWTI